MKIFKIALILVAAVLVMASCNQQASRNVTLKTAADSASYAIGVDLGNNIKMNLKNTPGGVKLDSSVMLAGFEDMLMEKDLKIPAEKGRTIIQAFFTKIQDQVAQENLEKGQKFLEENAKNDSVKTTDSGLQYKIIKQGTGAVPKAGQKVKVDYTGKTIDGKVFDSSIQRGKPVTFQVDRVIKGWTEALEMMPVGSEWMLYIPADLAYGKRGAGKDIGPNTTLIFEVHLLGIEK
jgi:FKBP-type peptidyl-prolyl cis-trans isomerase